MTKSVKKMATIKMVKPTSKAGRATPKIIAFFVFLLMVSASGVVYLKWDLLGLNIDWNEKLASRSSNSQTEFSDVDKMAIETNREWRVEVAHTVEFIDIDDLNRFAMESIDSSFFSLDIEYALSVLQQYPWVEAVNARKVWPNKLLIEVTERQPWLRLNDDALIARDGTVFRPNNLHLFEALPLLSGNYGKTEDLLSMYGFFTQQVASEGNAIRQLAFDPIKGWQLTLDNQIQLLVGKEHLAERLERVTEIFASFSEQQSSNIEYLDVRYQNGIAVGWHKANTTDQVARL